MKPRTKYYHKSERQINVHQYPVGQPDTTQQISGLTQGMFVGAVADILPSILNRKYFTVRLSWIPKK